MNARLRSSALPGPHYFLGQSSERLEIGPLVDGGGCENAAGHARDDAQRGHVHTAHEEVLDGCANMELLARETLGRCLQTVNRPLTCMGAVMRGERRRKRRR